jgi:hypothetical protein
MKFSCNKCGKVYTIDPSKIPSGKKTAKCKVCGGKVYLNIKTHKDRIKNSRSVQQKCDKCGYVRNESDYATEGQCPKCGVIYAKIPNEFDTKENHKLSPKEMIRCKECGVDFDKTAQKCPECNHPNKKSRSQIFPVAILILCIFWAISTASSSILYTWLISWVILGLLIAIKTKSIVSIAGGSFIASLVVVIIFANITGQIKTEDDSKSQNSKQQSAIDRKAKAGEAKKKREKENEKCKTDLQCWGDKHSFRAISACQDLIEKHAKYSFKWTDGFFGSKFSRFRWKNKEQLTLTYLGDTIQFQNGFGAWQNMRYQCGYDPINEKVLSVKVEPGRF